MNEIIDGMIILKYGSCCEDFINILLQNGYNLSIKLINNDKDIKILYCK